MFCTWRRCSLSPSRCRPSESPATTQWSAAPCCQHSPCREAANSTNWTLWKCIFRASKDYPEAIWLLACGHRKHSKRSNRQFLVVLVKLILTLPLNEEQIFFWLVTHIVLVGHVGVEPHDGLPAGHQPLVVVHQVLHWLPVLRGLNTNIHRIDTDLQ